MNSTDNKRLISQAEYAKKLRTFLPPEAFLPDSSKLWILIINLAILILGWAIAAHLDQWSVYLLWLYLPFAFLMGNSITVLSFSAHEMLHGGVTRNSNATRIFSFLGWVILWMPPTLWKTLHNRVHHNNTNSLKDPDRNYLSQQPRTWGNWIQNCFVPSNEVSPLGLGLGMASAWGVYTFRNLASVLLFNRDSVDFVPAAFQVDRKTRRTIAAELLLIAGIHLSILAYLQFQPLKVILAYFLPIALGYAGVIFYIYTNHLVCPMTAVNDPLLNTVSLRVPRIFDLLHLNFSYHAEHHIFPSINSDYYPMVQDLIRVHFPDRAGYILSAGEAWRLLLNTPRYYQDDITLTNWSGDRSIPCPLLDLPQNNSQGAEVGK